MSMRTYSGSCHGAVRFEADIDLSEGTNRCNCSICTKARAWFTLVSPERFRQIAGEKEQSEYAWAPPGHPGPNLHYRFCKTCGIRTVGCGDHGPKGGPFCFIALALIDNADPADLLASIRYVDGRHDHFSQPPIDVRLM